MNGGMSRERRQCIHRVMIGYDLCSAVIGSCDKSHLLFVCVPHLQISLNK